MVVTVLLAAIFCTIALKTNYICVSKMAVTALVVAISMTLVCHSVISAADKSNKIKDEPKTSSNITNSEDFVNKSAPSVNQSQPYNYETEEAPHGSTDTQSYQRYGIYNKPCEGGYSCGHDQWCSRDQRCRPCSDLNDWCHQTFTIHQNYTTCEDYCYRFQTGKTQELQAALQTANERIKDLSLELQNALSALDNVTMKADEERDTFSRLEAELKDQNKELDEKYKKQVIEITSKQAELVECRKRTDRCQEQKEETRTLAYGLQVGIALCVVAVAVITALAIKFKLDQRRLKAKRHGTDRATAEQHDNKPLVSSTSSELTAVTEVRSPVQAHRNSTHFNSQEDQLCLPPNQRPLVALMSGDSDVATP